MQSFLSCRSFQSSQSSKFPNPDATGPMGAAERELSAFFNAVLQMFGSEQAERAAEDWLRELSASAAMPATARGWRAITTRTTARLARRLNDTPLTTFMNA